MSTTTPLTDSINALTAYANEVTGASDTTLSDAVATLASGYGSGSTPNLLNSVTVTTTELYTSSNQLSVQLTASDSCMIAVVIDTFPSEPDSEYYIALYWFRYQNSIAGGGNGWILRPAGTIGTDSGLGTFNTSTGVLTMGGNYGYLLPNTTYHIYQIGVNS